MVYFYHLILRLHSGFASCPILSFIQNRFITESHYISFSCFFNQFLTLFLAFMTDILNIVGQLFCIMFLSLEYQKEILSGSAWFWLYHYSRCQSHVSDGVFQISKVTHLSTPLPHTLLRVTFRLCKYPFINERIFFLVSLVLFVNNTNICTLWLNFNNSEFNIGVYKFSLALSPEYMTYDYFIFSVF